MSPIKIVDKETPECQARNKTSDSRNTTTLNTLEFGNVLPGRVVAKDLMQAVDITEAMEESHGRFEEGMLWYDSQVMYTYQLKSWQGRLRWEEYGETGVVPVGKGAQEPKYSSPGVLLYIP